MSSISGLGAHGGSAMLTKFLEEDPEGATTLADLLQKKQEARQEKTTDAYGRGINSDVGRTALQQALEELSGQVDGKITFAKIEAYRQELEELFSLEVRAGLILKGLPGETEFTLSLDSEGKIHVQTQNAADKAFIEDFLAANPDLCERFGYIQALGNFERATRGEAWQSVRQAKATIQASAMESFFSASLDNGFSYSPLLASFSGTDTGGVSFYTGISRVI